MFWVRAHICQTTLAARAELHRLRAFNCAAKTQRDPDATLNYGLLSLKRAVGGPLSGANRKNIRSF